MLRSSTSALRDIYFMDNPCTTHGCITLKSLLFNHNKNTSNNIYSNAGYQRPRNTQAVNTNKTPRVLIPVNGCH